MLRFEIKGNYELGKGFLGWGLRGVREHLVGLGFFG